MIQTDKIFFTKQEDNVVYCEETGIDNVLSVNFTKIVASGFGRNMSLER